MIRIFIGIFLVFFMTEEGIAITLVSFIDIESIFLWKNVTFNNDSIICLTTKKFNDTTIQRLNEILIEVETLSEKYNEFTNHLAQKQNERWQSVIDQRYDDDLLPLIESKLIELIKVVDYMHKEAINDETEIKSFDEMATTRVQFLTNNLFKLWKTLDGIYKVFFPKFTHIIPKLLQLILMYKQRNLPYECNKYTSAQQFVYFIYITLIITEMKGLSTLIYISSMLQHTTQSNDDIIGREIAEKQFTKRVTDYYENIYKAMVSMPREIHRCEVNPPIRDENFLEFINYHQVRLFTTEHLRYNYDIHELSCITKCEDIDNSRLELETNSQMSNCHTIGLAKYIKTCPAKPESSRIYMWWEYDGKIYGHDESCPTALENGNGDRPYREECEICQCAVIPQDDKVLKNAILNISVTSQIADIENNMIVSGVKFVVYKKVLHLQIQQSKFVLNEINDNSSEWKSLENYQSNLKDLGIKSEMLSKFSGQIYLDDVMLPPKYAVTGVRFLTRAKSPAGFYLQIHGTPIDFATGKLDNTNSYWFATSSDFTKTADYERDRIEINVKNLDDPTRCRDYRYDRTANNYIKFHHSSVTKDGGQSTVPFIDAQPVETYPPFPLSGIGLFYRNKVGCGGYITPRIFTIDISQYN